MPTLLRNPFRRQDENVRPPSVVTSSSQVKSQSDPSKSAEAGSEKEPTEYKLSEINDSGVYLPPSPTERKSFWSTHSSRTSTSTSNHRNLLSETNEQFSISRESFESYRRSFDISARSPVISTYENGARPRASLDSRSFAPPSRTSNSFQRPSQVPPSTTEEREPVQGGDAFEEVDIGEKPVPPNQHKKRGLFSRITDSGEHAERPTSQDGTVKTSGGVWNHLTGRKRGQSGQGAELGAIPKRETTPRPESQLRQHVKQQSAGATAGAKLAGKKAPDTQVKASAVEAPSSKKEEPKADSAIDADVTQAQSNLEQVQLDNKKHVQSDGGKEKDSTPAEALKPVESPASEAKAAES